MNIKRTIQRRTSVPYRGREIVLIVPPHCDVIGLRQKGIRKVFEIDLASVYDLAVRREIAAEKAAKKGKLA